MFNIGPFTIPAPPSVFTADIFSPTLQQIISKPSVFQVRPIRKDQILMMMNLKENACDGLVI